METTRFDGRIVTVRVTETRAQTLDIFVPNNVNIEDYQIGNKLIDAVYDGEEFQFSEYFEPVLNYEIVDSNEDLFDENDIENVDAVITYNGNNFEFGTPDILFA